MAELLIRAGPLLLVLVSGATIVLCYALTLISRVLFADSDKPSERLSRLLTTVLDAPSRSRRDRRLRRGSPQSLPAIESNDPP